jgi:hypothetical protein
MALKAALLFRARQGRAPTHIGLLTISKKLCVELEGDADLLSHRRGS